MAGKKKTGCEPRRELPSWVWLARRHGSRMLVVSRGDWDKVRETARRFPEAHEALKGLGVLLTSVEARDGRGRLVPEPKERKACEAGVPGPADRRRAGLSEARRRFAEAAAEFEKVDDWHTGLMEKSAKTYMDRREKPKEHGRALVDLRRAGTRLAKASAKRRKAEGLFLDMC